MVLHYPALNRPVAPVCSVCIANYNGAHMLATCLDSVLAQDIRVPVEVIVHDDASTDDSISFLRAHYPQVDILASDENVGFCIGNNRMVAKARGEFVLLLNNDAALQPGALSVLLSEARDIGACILTLPQYDMVGGALVDRGCLLDMFYNPVPNLDPSRSEVAMAIGACLFLPRMLWSELGGFPEWMESIAEDMYLCCVARVRGLPVRVTEASGYLHRQGATFGGNRVDAGKLCTTYRRRYLSERNKTSVMLVCTPSWLLWPLFLLHMVFFSLEGLTLTLLKRKLRIWRDIYGRVRADVIWHFAALLSRRHDVQQVRRTSLSVYFRMFIWTPYKLRMLWRHGMPSVR